MNPRTIDCADVPTIHELLLVGFSVRGSAQLGEESNLTNPLFTDIIHTKVKSLAWQRDKMSHLW